MIKPKLKPLDYEVDLVSSEFTDGISLFRLHVSDPFDNQSREYICKQSLELGREASNYYQTQGREPRRKSKLEPDNPSSKALFENPDNVAIKRWRTKHVPTAAALFPLQRPDLKILADGTKISDSELEWFKHCLDGIGLRSRSAIMQHILSANDKTKQDWLSLASGASLPTLEATHHLRDKSDVSITALDFDKKALKLSNHIAKQFGFEKFKTHRSNILNEKSVRKTLGNQDFDVVEILGLFEYLKPEDWYYRYQKVVVRGKKKMLGARNFLNLAYSYVKPGGKLIFGNMLDSHPHLDFTLKVVQWPHIRPRSIAEVRDIIETSGIPSDYKLSVYLPDDGVYAVYVLEKML